NGRVVPAARERSNAAEVGWARWDKKEVGKLTPGTAAWQAKFGRLLGCRDPHARLSDMDALGTDQVMLFPTWFVRLALVRSAEAATVLAQAYNNWVLDYCAADRKRLFPCAVLPLQSVEASIAELKRVACETRGVVMVAMTWVAVVVHVGWLEKFPRLRPAVLESNASWLPLILSRSSNFSNLYAFQRDNRLIRDPVDVFNERCFIGFES